MGSGTESATCFSAERWVDFVRRLAAVFFFALVLARGLDLVALDFGFLDLLVEVFALFFFAAFFDFVTFFFFMAKDRMQYRLQGL